MDNVRKPAEVIVRTASGDELERAGMVCAAAYRADGVSSSAYEQLLLDAPQRARSAEVLVAVTEDDRMLGTVTYVDSDGPYAEIRREHEAELRMLAVAPNWRRGGIGATLVRACLHKAREDQLAGAVVSTARQMQAAHRLYRRLGFRRSTARDWSTRTGLPLEVYELGLAASAGQDA